MSGDFERERFERLVLVHMDAAYSLACWLVRNKAQAEEAVQEAYLRAFRFFGGFRGGDARPWLLGIVRNTCYTLMHRERESGAPEEFDEASHGEEALAPGAVVGFPANPETAVIESADRELVRRCLRALPPEYREALVLREMHDCSYREIAAIAGIPIGTVMSRLARGRRLLQRALTEQVKRGGHGNMNCRDAVRVLNAYVDAELDAAGALAVEDHLATCARCRGLHANLQSLRSVVRRHAEPEQAPERLHARLRAHFAAAPAVRANDRRAWLAFVFSATAALVLAAWVALGVAIEQREQPARAHAKVVYHISSSDTAAAALRTLGNHLEAAPGVKVVVVAHNRGIDFLLRGARDESGQLYEAAVRRFAERGVEFRICGNTLVRRKIDASEVIPGATLVPSGIAEIGRLQGEEGYAYLRL